MAMHGQLEKQIQVRGGAGLEKYSLMEADSNNVAGLLAESDTDRIVGLLTGANNNMAVVGWK